MRLLRTLLVAMLPLAGMGDYLNPCGIIQGGDAWFRIGFGGVSPPDSEIEWLQSGVGLVSFPDGDHGTTVRVRGETCGDVKLEVQIGDARSRRPCFHAKVVTNSVVGVSVWVISDGTTPATSSGRVAEMLNMADMIWRQAGISFRLDECLVTNRSDMLDVGYTSANGEPTVYDVAALNPEVGGIKVYFVNRIVGVNTNLVVNGVTFGSKILISANAGTKTLAHELGHSFGLQDVYSAYPGVPQSACGPVRMDMTPDDWNGGTGQRYYAPGTGIESLIPRLLMYGGGGEARADITIGDVYGLWYSNEWNAATHSYDRIWQVSLAPVGFFRHGTGVPQSGNEENMEEGKMSAVINIVAAVSAGALATGEGLPAHERAADEEKALQTLVKFAVFDHYADIAAAYECAFEEVGKDKERMTRVLVRSARDAYTRKYESWNQVAQCSIGSLSEYGTKTAISFLESVLTNDVYGAGGNAAKAYVRLAGDDGRDFEFFKRNFGVGKHVPRDVGKVIYRTLKSRLDGKGLPEEMRREYVDYLMSRAECEKDILTGHMLDKMLVEIVPGYKDGEKRKANLGIIAKPDPNHPHIVFRRESGGDGAGERRKEDARP